ncbi:sensor histidine kinase [Fundicoccus sp. Sow4_H7]|uniref:sensor histidine kinase n=1 Tax=Fundicoccus sp. Sow4_H7 TaxID=3438784 RepID=UPI003F93D2F1
MLNLYRRFKNSEFGQNVGLIPFVFLIYLIPLLMAMYPFAKPLDWLMLVLLALFIRWYLLGFYEERQTKVTFYSLLAIGCAFTIYNGYASLFIYPAWLFSFWTISKKTFLQYLTIYYVLVTVSSAISLITNLNEIADIWLTIVIGLAFVYFSPIMARTIYNEQMRVEQLDADNKRLMTIIKQGERDRIAQDLHDTMGQSYSTMAVKAELAAKLVDKQPEAAMQELKDIAEMSRANLNLVREIIANLNERTIATALIEASHVLKAKDIAIVINGEAESVNWPIEIQYIIAAVIKEGTTNIIRHSQASKATYRFEKFSSYYQFMLQDNGVGLKNQRHQGFGIHGIENRVRSASGEFILSRHHGTTITIQLPITRND